jgi:hypothetical protein
METPEVPVEVSPEAAARIAELGMGREFEAMLGWVRRHAPKLRRIEVSLGCWDGAAPKWGRPVMIRAWREEPAADDPPELIEWDWAGWKAEHFPRAVIHFPLRCSFLPPAAAA